jgi:glycosyltransferase involved in cell wall biosynthesis
MRILISISYYSPHISGLTNATKNLAELLTQNGYTVTVLATQHSKALPLKENINGIKVERIPYLFKLYKGFIMPSFIFYVYKALKKCDQVIINLPQAEGFIVAVLAKLFNKKIHSIYHCEIVFSQKQRRAKLMKFIFTVADSITLALTDSIIMTSDDFAKSTSFFEKYQNKIKIVNLVISPPSINKNIEEDLVKKLPKKRYRIGFIGRIAAEKGVEYLLDTIPQLREKLDNDFVIVIAGPTRVIGEQKYLEKITRLMDEYKDNIVRIGELKEEELGAFYSMLDVLALPSINSTEAFGMVQVEAMLCGTPVVASDLPGVRVPVQATGMGELVNIKDSTDLNENLIKVLKDKSNYAKKQEVVENIFSTKKATSEYENLLR